jgi:hypothetical protein
VAAIELAHVERFSCERVANSAEMIDKGQGIQVFFL